MKSRGLAVVLLFVFLAGCGSGVSTSEYNKIVDENNKLQAELEALTSELADVRAKADKTESSGASAEQGLSDEERLLLAKDKLRAVVDASYPSQMLINELAEIILGEDLSSVDGNLGETRDKVLNDIDKLDNIDSVEAVYNAWVSGVEQWNNLYETNVVDWARNHTEQKPDKASNKYAAQAESKEKPAAKEQNEEPAPEKTEIPAEGSQALKKAKEYLNFTAFSHDGLIDQLKYEGFPDDACKYAADNCGADWSAQAVKKAKEYLDFTSFSKSGLIDQLVYEKFTRDQATYGAEQALQ